MRSWKLLEVLKDQLESEGIGVATAKKGPVLTIMIETLEDRRKFDIAIPITKPSLIHNTKKLSELKPESFDPIYDREELEETFRVKLKMDFAVTQTEIHQADMMAGTIPMSQELLSSIVSKVVNRAKLATVFSELYPLIRTYVSKRCFGREVDVDAELIRSHLQRLEIQEGIAGYLTTKISTLTVEKKTLEFENEEFRLSQTRPFSWRRDLQKGPCECKKTVFNYVATYNDFERQFALFLDRAKDVVRFSSLGTTEQGDSATKFRVDYLKPSGAIGFYHPDWVVIQKDGDSEVNWIIETKGRVWEDTPSKDSAITDWCLRMSKLSGKKWKFKSVNQSEVSLNTPKSLSEILEKKQLLS